jgi:hypothetical protein
MPRKSVHPSCHISADPNVARKTTFATEYLPEHAKCVNFINPDLLARAYSPFDPDYCQGCRTLRTTARSVSGRTKHHAGRWPQSSKSDLSRSSGADWPGTQPTTRRQFVRVSMPFFEDTDCPSIPLRRFSGGLRATLSYPEATPNPPLSSGVSVNARIQDRRRQKFASGSLYYPWSTTSDALAIS